MSQKITLTPSQIALAEADDVVVDGSILPAEEEVVEEESLEEVPESAESEEAPSSEKDYYEQIGEDNKDEASQDQSWLTEELQAYGESYGLSQEDILRFESAEQLQRFGEMTDRSMTQNRVASSEVKSPDPPEEGGEDTDDLIDIEMMRENNYDEISIQMAERMNANRQNERQFAEYIRNQDLKSSEASAAEKQQEFNAMLDDIDPALFGLSQKDGKTAEISVAHLANRNAVKTTMELLKVNMQAQAQELGADVTIPEKVLVERAVRATFGGVDSGSNAKKIEAQSRRRRPTGANRGQNAGVAPASRSSATKEDDVNAIAQSPKMRAFWEKAQRQNGQA